MSLLQNNLPQRFSSHWQQHFGHVKGTVLLACSGGLDSMAQAELFHMFEVPFALAHCNFGLRGDEADADEQLVCNWASEHGIEFHAVRFDTAAVAATTKRGIQETARKLRYSWLEDIREAWDYAAIATAHHSGDVAETVLFNLFRGTGLAGMHGIAAVNGLVIRPLLFTGKEELRQFAAETGVPWREDASNDLADYSRNVIRNQIIPAVETHFPDALKRITETSGRLAEAEIIYRKAAEKELRRLSEKRGADLYVPLRKLRLAKPLATLIYELFSPAGFSPAQVPEIIKLMDAGAGAAMQSDSHRIIRDREFLIVTANATAAADLVMIECAPQTIDTAEATFSFKILPADLIVAEKAPAAIAYVDADKLEWPLKLRVRRAGDYFYPLGMGGKKKKLGRFLTSQKVPAHQKDSLQVLESGQRIVWIAGQRIDERFKVTAATKTMLEVRMTAKAGF